MRGLLSRWLTDRGYDVTGAASEFEALAVMSAVPPEVTVCDAAVSAQDGLQLARRLRTQYPATPIVTIAGRRDLRPFAASVQDGADECLFMPVVAERLLTAVEHARLSRPPRTDPPTALPARVSRPRSGHIPLWTVASPCATTDVPCLPRTCGPVAN